MFLLLLSTALAAPVTVGPGGVTFAERTHTEAPALRDALAVAEPDRLDVSWSAGDVPALRTLLSALTLLPDGHDAVYLPGMTTPIQVDPRARPAPGEHLVDVQTRLLVQHRPEQAAGDWVIQADPVAVHGPADSGRFSIGPGREATCEAAYPEGPLRSACAAEEAEPRPGTRYAGPEGACQLADLTQVSATAAVVAPGAGVTFELQEDDDLDAWLTAVATLATEGPVKLTPGAPEPLQGCATSVHTPAQAAEVAARLLGRSFAHQAQPIVLNATDKALIDEVIKADMKGLRRCYVRAQRKQRDLAGKVVLKFVIAADGSVSETAIQQSTLAHEGVEACLQERFAKLAFPPVKGGGIAIVSYPFLFSPS